MPITKSAKKFLRQSAKRQKKNLYYKDKMKALVKEVRLLISQNKKEEAKKLMSSVFQILDKSAKKNIIKKNAASRKKSRLAKSLAKIK